MARSIRFGPVLAALALASVAGCGGSSGDSTTSPATEQSPTCTTAAGATTPASTVAAGERVVLAPDGLGPAKFGQPNDTAVSLLTDVLGPPLYDERLPADQQVVWGDWDGTLLTAYFTVSEADGVSYFTAWQLRGYEAIEGVELVTAEGIALGTSVAELLAAHPDAIVAAQRRSDCGDGWWLPNLFEFGGGLRAITGYEQGESEALYQMALDGFAEQGHPIDFATCGDAGCWAKVAEYQRSVGLPDSGHFDRATWLALGLPLPADPTAIIRYLEAGTGIPYC